jgi:hypothetical protein
MMGKKVLTDFNDPRDDTRAQDLNFSNIKYERM